MLSSKNKWFGWQLNMGINYGETMMMFSIYNLTNAKSDMLRRGCFMGVVLFFDLGKDKFLLNYNLSHHDTDDNPLSFEVMNNGFSYEMLDITKHKRLRQEGMVTY